jgi:hypothetical protein
MDELEADDQQLIEECYRRCFSDRLYAIEHLTWITDKNGKKRLLEPWEGQQRFIRWKRYCVEQPGQWTLIVVKLRQGGITTVSIGDSLLDCVMKEGQDHIYLCKAGEDKEALFDRLKLMDEQLPPEFKLPKQRDQSTAIKYELPHGSSVRILESGDSARVSAKKGRSATCQYLHITEAAYIEHLSLIMGGASGSVSPNGCICLESTPNGPQGYMYSLAMKVYSEGREVEPNVWRHGTNILLFLPYYDHPEYQSKNELEGDLDEKEQRLREIGAPDSAIQWRREWIASKANDDKTGLTPVEMFDREYPAELMDGFRASGRGFFRINIVQAMQSMYSVSKAVKIGLDANFQPCAPNGPNTFTIYAPPVKGWKNRYCLFMDCGEGLATSDFDCAYVFDRVAREIVACHYGRFGARLQTENCEKLAEYYYKAWMSHDRTGIGADRIPYLERMEDVNIYYKDLENPCSEGMGLKWSEDNRRTTLSTLLSNCEMMDWKIPDRGFWTEAEHFTYPENGGSPRAASGFHDDKIMAAAGIAWLDQRIPRPIKEDSARSNIGANGGLISKFSMQSQKQSIGNY